MTPKAFCAGITMVGRHCKESPPPAKQVRQQHLELPLWLEEGIAVSTERQVAITGRDDSDAVATRGNHRAFRNAERFQEFWSGQSFDGTDMARALSRDLARTIVERLRKEPSFVEFVTNASRDDGGAAAALGLLKQGLCAIAAAALHFESHELATS